MAAQPDRYLETLRERVLVFDGAMGSNLQSYDLSAADFGGKLGCNDYLTLTRPDIVAEVHAGFLEAGCDVIETASFQSTRPRLTEWGLGELVLEINRAAARLARELADRYSTPSRPRFVAGSIGPTGFLPSSDDPTLGDVSYEQLAEWFREQAQGLVEGGVDLLLIETAQDILEVKAAIAGIRRYFRESGRRVPVQAQVTLDTAGRMLLGTDVAAALATLEALRVDVLGLNCSTGPDYMREPVRFLSERSRTPIAVIPNAGIPLNQDGRACYPLEPEPLAAALEEFIARWGVNVVGGCCGTTHEHLRAVVRRCWGRRPLEREVTPLVAISSGMRAVPLRQDPPPLLVGERVNSQGSRRVKRLLLADDYEGVVRIAREQVEGGAHALDVCVALTERQDEAQQMSEVVRRLRTAVEAPLFIDTTEPEVVRAALERYPGRAVINSINLEGGRAKADRVLELAREHGAAVIALAIDERGMAHSVERKLEVCARIYDLAVGEHGLAPEALIFDVLTFPVTTGQAELADDAAATIEGVRRVKAELPGCLTSLGVSNVSFGVTPAARAVLNSVFLYHAVQAGLDLALVHPAEITPYAEVPAEARRLADDLIFNRHPDALPAFIAYFERAGAVAKEPAADPTAGLTVAERIHWQILHRKKEGIEALLDAALAEGRDAVAVLNDILLPAMKEVGDRFGAGELILPFVLQSAEVMKRAVAHLEPHFARRAGYTKGKVVLATVFGDVHDIGKSLVNTILTNNGYTVYDLGKQVPANVIIEKAVEVGADAIGLSALLVSTSKQMPLVVQELAARGLRIPVLIGGAAINRSFGRRTAFLPDGRYYEPGVFYAKDAFEGLAIMDRLTDSERRAAFLAQARAEAEEERRLAALGGGRPAPAAPPERPAPSRQVAVPRPPFWGYRVLERIPHAEVWPLLDRNTLFRLHWGGSRFSGERYAELVEREFEPLLERLTREVAAEGIIEPRALYGYYPCAAEGDTLVIFDPDDPARELARFPFPRQPDGGRLCIADYFRPRPAGSEDAADRDVIAFQVVTAGARVADRFAELNARGEYARAYYLHGLAQSTAEALAEHVNRLVRRELGLAGERGRRYSWGYLACPDLEQQETLFRFFPAERIGVRLTTGYQLDPEASTAAFVVHHPEAVYFSARPPQETRGPAAARAQR